MKAKIVLIEDNQAMRENVSEILELSDYEVHSAPNGKEGVRLIRDQRPDIVLCDIMMPELDGYGVLHILHRDPETRNIPFIFLTAKAEEADRRRGMNLGADDYLTKPFEDIELLDAVEMRLSKRQTLQKDFGAGEEGLSAFVREAHALEALEELKEDRERRRVSAKDTIFEEGSQPRYLFLVLSGRVKTTRNDDFGKELTLGLRAAGDYLGAADLLRETPYSETAVALEDSEILLIPADEFYALIFADKDVSAMFTKIIAGELAETEQRLLQLAYGSVRKRVSQALLRLRDKFGEEGQPFSIQIQREDLASLCGTAKETAIRTLTDFRQEGLISIGEDGAVQILDEQGLRNLVA